MAEENWTSFILAIGSNHNCDDAIEKAKIELQENFEGMRFTNPLCTTAIGKQGDDFINLLACGNTQMSLNELKKLTKKIETKCGNRKELRSNGLIAMDIDILLYGDEKYHLNDWNRPYIKQLMTQL